MTKTSTRNMHAMVSFCCLFPDYVYISIFDADVMSLNENVYLLSEKKIYVQEQIQTNNTKELILCSLKKQISYGQCALFYSLTVFILLSSTPKLCS